MNSRNSTALAVLGPCSSVERRRAIRFGAALSPNVFTQVCALILLAGCQAKEAREAEPPPKSTSLVGQVFVQPENGGPIRAAGRTVRISRPDSAAIVQAREACTKASRFEEAIAGRITGKRRVGPEEPPLEMQIRIFEEFVTSGVRRAFEWNGKEIASQVTDIDGKFTISDIPPGRYVATATHQQDGRTFSWTEVVDVRSGVSNSAILGSEAAGWVGLCAKVSSIAASLTR